MADSIKKTFIELKAKNKSAYVPYFSLGYPDYDTSYNIILNASENFDILELGIPFSDPIADGPVISEANHYVIQNHFNMNKTFEITEKIASKIKAPIVFMMYFNQIIAMGTETFLKKSRDAGVSGLIVPDLAADSQPDFNETARNMGFDTIFLTTPITDEERLKLIINECRGYIYYTQVTGITGIRKGISSDMKENIAKIRKLTELPVSVGFGVSEPSQAKQIAELADGVIMGSAIIKKLSELLTKTITEEEIQKFIKDTNNATFHT